MALTTKQWAAIARERLTPLLGAPPDVEFVDGVTSHAVSQRTQEVGIRMAMGARRSDVRWLILRQHVAPAVVGIVVGIAGAFVLTRFLGSLLYGVGAVDPATYALVTAAVMAVVVAACWLPASRAMRVDPLVALRPE
jgi:ABC-type antimicrobial peptide transport system permease subunit